MKSDIGIIGANGYIGRHVAQSLLKKGREPILFGKQNKSIDQHKNYFKMDLCDVNTLPDHLASCNYIFFLAGLSGASSGPESNSRFVEINEIGLLNLLEYFRKKNRRPKIIFPSTRLIYKGQKDVPLKENDEKKFKTVYAVTKFTGEQYLRIYQNMFNVPYTVFRICVPYGNCMDETMSYGTFNHFLAKARNKKDITIYGDGSQKRSLIYIQDLADIIITGGLDHRTDNDVFNISGPDVLSISEIAHKIAKHFGITVNSIPWPDIEKKIESGDTIFDSSKLDGIIDVRYTKRFEMWLDELS